MRVNKREPEHHKFTYKAKDILPSGAIKGCVCKKCAYDNTNYRNTIERREAEMTKKVS